MAWAKGQSGNPAGSKPKKMIAEAIKLALSETEEKDGKKVKRLRLLAERLVKEALDGNVVAMKEIADRCDGKSVQPHAGPDGDEPLSITIIERRIVETSN